MISTSTFARHLKLAGACRNYDFLINRGPSSSCLLKHIHPRTLTPSSTFDYETLKIARACQRKFFLSFQSFAFYADADAGPTPVDPTSGHSHPSPKPYHPTAEVVFVLTLSSF
mmetsp:Transcript_55416/g.115978  ORF Transcript_55416/g.115978 Transcript_55416/m.115978 type:complete len:113 (-) Transcript_55416:690-1028(-)